MKIKVAVTVTREIEIKREYYPDGLSDEQILACEIGYSEDLFHEWLDADNVQWEHKGEILKETTHD